MINVIADRYAQALFEVGEETQTTSELYQELSELVDILNENKDLYNFLKSPLIGREDKKNVMQNIFKNQLSDSMNNFLKVVIDKDRMSTIEYIKESYKSLLNDKNNILEGTAITAVELSEKEIKDLEKNLSIIREVLQTIQDIIFNHDLPNTKENENQELFLASCVCPSCKENVVIPREMYDYFKEKKLKVPCPCCGKNGLNKNGNVPVDDRLYYQNFWQYNETIVKYAKTMFENED